MNIEKLFNKTLSDFLDKYSDTGEMVGSQIQKTITNSRNAEIIIPVLGMQGMGKSTLINGLLQENILPNDADETTCVPVEVKYGEKEYALVHFFDNPNTVVVHSREELNEYVDNNYNLANKKHVSHIELFRKLDLLNGGITIVDLPGVGSLTKENEKTTKRYVENLCSAIFVIPTVPTIRNKEALFIKSLWSQFSKAIFVQNHWGESKEEMNESIEFNKMVLSKIAKELHNPYDGEILIVDAYNAVYGAVNANKSLVDKSNIHALRDKIRDVSGKWDVSMENVLHSRIILAINYAISLIEKRLADIEKTREQVEEDNQRVLAEFDKDTQLLRDKGEEVKKYLSDKAEDFHVFAREQSRECCSKIRSELFQVVDNGTFDGTKLTQAFNRIQNERCQDFSDVIFPFISEVQFHTEEMLEEMHSIELNKNLIFEKAGIYKKSALKWEKGVQFLANIGGAVASLGAKSLLVFLGASNPAGWLVCGVGLVIYGLFSLFGNSVKKTVQEKRAIAIKSELRPKINDIERSLQQSVTNKFEEFTDQCKGVIEDMLASRSVQRENLIKTLNKVDDTSKNDLLKDYEYIKSIKKNFENVG